MLPVTVYGQGLFESAINDSCMSVTAPAKSFSLSGHVKSTLCGGQNSDNEAVVSAGNTRVALTLAAEKPAMGKAFAEVRLTAGTIRDSSAVCCDVREAWVSVCKGPFDIKAGRQIIVWGRADAINPTNMITPKNETVLSSEHDDTRKGNELIQAKVKIGPSSLQGIWVPCFRPDVLPIAGADIPAGITIADPAYPDTRLANGGYALRAELTRPSIDGSISYFNGYPTMPGFDFTLTQAGLGLIPRAYRMHVGGADFSTVIGSIGLRGEAAIKYPSAEHETHVHVPNPHAQYVLGIDKGIGNWSVLCQYSGCYVFDYTEVEEAMLTDPFDPLAQAAYAYALASAEIRQLNRLFIGTADETNHSITGNLQWNTRYETLHLKLAGMYNVTTEDYAISPGVSYDIADAVNLTVGGRYIDGPKGNLNNMVSNLMSFVYAECKVSF